MSSPAQCEKERKRSWSYSFFPLQSDHATWTLFLDSNTCLQYNRPADTLYEGAILRARLIFPEVSLPPPPRGLADVQEYPLQPPKMIFDSEMWHPNVYSTSDKKGEVCISILVNFHIIFALTVSWSIARTGRRWMGIWRCRREVVTCSFRRDCRKLPLPTNLCESQLTYS